MARRLYSTMYERLVANTRVDEDGCWIWTGAVRKHYPSLCVRVNGKPRAISAHRKMLEISTGWLFPFDEAGHYRCFKTLCIHPDHLRIETVAENLSTRRGYKPCEGRWIPVLFPTPERLRDEALDAFIDKAWDGIGGIVHPANEPCPF